MSDPLWIRIAAADSIPPREGRSVTVGGRQIALFNLGGRFFATDNRCPHRGGPLCDGIVAGTAVVCPLHAWKINLETGAVERPAAGGCTRAYTTRVERGIVMVALPLEKGEAA